MSVASSEAAPHCHSSFTAVDTADLANKRVPIDPCLFLHLVQRLEKPCIRLSAGERERIIEDK